VSSVIGAELETRWFRGVTAELLSSGLPLNVHSNVYENGHRAKPGPGLLFGFSVYSSNVATQFIQVHDTQTAPATGAVPAAVFAVGAASHLAISYIFPGRFHDQGIWIGNSTTGPTYTAGVADCFFDVQFA
jgi:hypothetical protein